MREESFAMSLYLQNFILGKLFIPKFVYNSQSVVEAFDNEISTFKLFEKFIRSINAQHLAPSMSFNDLSLLEIKYDTMKLQRSFLQFLTSVVSPCRDNNYYRTIIYVFLICYIIICCIVMYILYNKKKEHMKILFFNIIFLTFPTKKKSSCYCESHHCGIQN